MKSRTIDVWEQTVENPPKGYKEYFIKEISFLKKNLSKDLVVLDVGCGTGRTIKELAPFAKKFIGIDNDKTAIKASKKNLREVKNAEILFEDAENMSFRDKIFDIVFIGLTFCNFADSKMKILSEIKRTLKDSGHLIFSVFNENSLEIRRETYKEYKGGYTILDEKKGKVVFNADGGISEHFSKEEITQILNEAGFEILKIEKGELYYLIKAGKSKSKKQHFKNIKSKYFYE